MLFIPPVKTVLHPSSWARPSGNTDFEVTQWFGCTHFAAELPYGGCDHYHRGIDLWNGRAGDPVVAVANGVVTAAGPDSYSGNAIRVWIKHPGGWFSGYYHLSNEIVTPGQSVTAGQGIGHVGSTGWSTGPHLHFEVHANDDRFSFFNPWPNFYQNVTIRPVGVGVNIRTSPSTTGAIYAVTNADGLIHHVPDGVNLGPTGAWRGWGGTVTGGSYTINGVTSNLWHKIYFGSGYQYIAKSLSVLSQT
jgi:murein DD-endopeptidase MepM/ murein hydrolase activator NlpD